MSEQRVHADDTPLDISSDITSSRAQALVPAHKEDVALVRPSAFGQVDDDSTPSSNPSSAGLNPPGSSQGMNTPKPGAHHPPQTGTTHHTGRDLTPSAHEDALQHSLPPMSDPLSSNTVRPPASSSQFRLDEVQSDEPRMSDETITASSITQDPWAISASTPPSDPSPIGRVPPAVLNRHHGTPLPVPNFPGPGQPFTSYHSYSTRPEQRQQTATIAAPNTESIISSPFASYSRQHPLPPIPVSKPPSPDPANTSHPSQATNRHSGNRWSHSHLRYSDGRDSTGSGMAGVGSGSNYRHSDNRGSSSRIILDDRAGTQGGANERIMHSFNSHPAMGSGAQHMVAAASHSNINVPPNPNGLPPNVNPRSTNVDWIFPPDGSNKPLREKNISERLETTLLNAKHERDKCARKAKITSYALNIAIGLQVILGSLTTGLSVVTEGRQTSIMTAVLGGCATIVASYLARARGSNEPELSIGKVKDLEHFIRECEAYKADYGHILGTANPEHEAKLEGFRNRFEELLGNVAEERKSSSPA